MCAARSNLSRAGSACSARFAYTTRGASTNGRTLKYRGQKLEQLPGRGALAALDHAQVGDRGCDAGIALDTAHRQLLQCQSVALAYRAQLGAEKMALAQQLRHSLARPLSVET